MEGFGLGVRLRVEILWYNWGLGSGLRLRVGVESLELGFGVRVWSLVGVRVWSVGSNLDNGVVLGI